MKFMFRGQEFELCTKLRVAFLVQKAHNHQPYTQVFSNMSNMPIEKQLELLWISFREANAEYVLSQGLTLGAFQDELLDESNLTYVLEALTGVVEGIMYHGMSEEEIEIKKAQSLEMEQNTNLVGGKSSDGVTG